MEKKKVTNLVHLRIDVDARRYKALRIMSFESGKSITTILFENLTPKFQSLLERYGAIDLNSKN